MDTWSASTKGFTLIGVLVALLLLVAGAVAVGRLVATSQRTAGIARETFVAANVAREGIELVRAMRDTNWFLARGGDANHHWTAGLCDPEGDTDFTGSREFTVDAQRVRNLDEVGDADEAQLYIAPNNEWTHESAQVSTPYRRVVTVDCANKDSEEQATLAITSTVQWNRGGQQRTVDMKEVLYHWLPEGEL